MITLHPDLADFNVVLREEGLELWLLEPCRVIPDIDLMLGPDIQQGFIQVPYTFHNSNFLTFIWE